MTQPVALVTGASSGIGRATAGLMATRGFRVFGTSRASRDREEQGFAMLPLDVRNDASVEACVGSVLVHGGRIDVLVNCAGYMQTGAIEENDIADALAQFETNVFGVMRMAKAVLPAMRRQGQGRIINVGSLLGQLAPSFAGLYGSSKFALEGLSEALRGELRPFNIEVSLIEPGFVKSDIVGQGPRAPLAEYDTRRRLGEAFARQGVERGMDPLVVARVILLAATVSRPRLRYPVGGASHALIALKRFLPEWAMERLRRRAFPAETASAT